MPRLGPEVRATLAPLMNAMQRLPDGDRAAWLQDLRSDAPTVVASLEAMLQESTAPVAPRTGGSGLRRLLMFIGI